MTTENNPVKRAVDAAGGALPVAKHFQISTVSVYEWITNGKVPAERAPALERLCERAVRCEEFCPNVDWAYLRTPAADVEQATS